MLLQYLLMIPVQLQSWPCKRPLTTTSSAGDANEDAFQKHGGLPPPFPQCTACVAQGVCYPNPVKGSQISLPACTKVVLLTVTESRISLWVAWARCVDLLQTHIGVAGCRVNPPLFGRYFGLSFGMCCQPRGRGQRQNIWGLLILPRALKEKVIFYWSSDLCLWLVTNFTLTKIIL